jgi:hypothetical protein
MYLDHFDTVEVIGTIPVTPIGNSYAEVNPRRLCS